MRKFGDGVVFPNLTWTIDFDHLIPEEKCIVVDVNNIEGRFSSRDYLKKMNFEVPWHTLQDMRLNFTLKTLTYIKVSEGEGNLSTCTTSSQLSHSIAAGTVVWT